MTPTAQPGTHCLGPCHLCTHREHTLFIQGGWEAFYPSPVPSPLALSRCLSRYGDNEMPLYCTYCQRSQLKPGQGWEESDYRLCSVVAVPRGNGNLAQLGKQSQREPKPGLHSSHCHHTPRECWGRAAGCKATFPSVPQMSCASTTPTASSMPRRSASQWRCCSQMRACRSTTRSSPPSRGPFALHRTLTLSSLSLWIMLLLSSKSIIHPPDPGTLVSRNACQLQGLDQDAGFWNTKTVKKKQRSHR